MSESSSRWLGRAGEGAASSAFSPPFGAVKRKARLAKLFPSGVRQHLVWILEELIMDVIHTLQQKKLLRVDEAAQILNVSRWTVYRWVEAGRLGGTRLGVGSLRIFSDTVAALIDLHCVGVSPATPVERSIAPISTKQRSLKHRYADSERGRARQPVAI